MQHDIASLRRILRSCRTIAVVGLSADWNRPSNFAAKYMQQHGYRIIPVNPRYAEVLGERCHARLESFGPNDGSILLADAPKWPGHLCPVWGADHYLRPREDVRTLLAALLRSFAQ